MPGLVIKKVQIGDHMRTMLYIPESPVMENKLNCLRILQSLIYEQQTPSLLLETKEVVSV